MLRLGSVLGDALVPGDLVILEGELGAGKTFLVRHLARALGVAADDPVTSPTFALVHEFDGRIPLVHADLYRIDRAVDVHELGLSARREDAVTCVEWGERFVSVLGAPTAFVRLSFGDSPDSRVAEIETSEDRLIKPLSRLAALGLLG